MTEKSRGVQERDAVDRPLSPLCRRCARPHLQHSSFLAGSLPTALVRPAFSLPGHTHRKREPATRFERPATPLLPCRHPPPATSCPPGTPASPCARRHEGRAAAGAAAARRPGSPGLCSAHVCPHQEGRSLAHHHCAGTPALRGLGLQLRRPLGAAARLLTACLPPLPPTCSQPFGFGEDGRMNITVSNFALWKLGTASAKASGYHRCAAAGCEARARWRLLRERAAAGGGGTCSGCPASARWWRELAALVLLVPAAAAAA